MIRGIIFDLGSTLIRFDGDWGEVMLESHGVLTDFLVESGLELDRVEFNEAFGEEVIENYKARMHNWEERTTASLLLDVLGRYGQTSVSTGLVEEAVRRMYAVSEAHWTPMPQVYEVLEGLQDSGLRLGMISNASDAGNVERLIDQARLRPYFDPILISANEGVRKPDERLFEKVLLRWTYAPEQVVMIGDLLGADILGAQRAGMHQIWLTAQADSPHNEAFRGEVQPEAAAERLAEVPGIIRSLDGAEGDA